MGNRSTAIAILFFLVTIFLVPAAYAGAADWLNPAKHASGGEDLEKAKGDYMLNCSMCHGENGDGKGDLADSLSVPPRNHTDATYMSSKTDEDLFNAISGGGASVGKAEDMPPHSTILSKKQIHGLVKYLRHLCNCQYKKK